MFGHDDDKPSTDTGTVQPTQTQDNDPPNDGTLTVNNNDDTASTQDNSPVDQAAPLQPAEPSNDEPTTPLPEPTTPENVDNNNTANTDSAPDAGDDSLYHEDEHKSEDSNVDLPAPVSSAPDLPAEAPSEHSADDLLSIKQEALQQLSPLVGHLDQTPEEKFHTSMMMIQASDDQSLIQAAFSAAKDITDDKTRAQALLDIINEINYFTQHQSTEQ